MFYNRTFFSGCLTRNPSSFPLFFDKRGSWSATHCTFVHANYSSNGNALLDDEVLYKRYLESCIKVSILHFLGIPLNYPPLPSKKNFPCGADPQDRAGQLKYLTNPKNVNKGRGSYDIPWWHFSKIVLAPRLKSIKKSHTTERYFWKFQKYRLFFVLLPH